MVDSPSDKQLDEYEKLLRESELRTSEANVRGIQQDIMTNAQDTSMIKEQLDMGDELDRIDYLLRGYVIEKDDVTGETKWVAPEDNSLVILSDYGVHLIRNTLAWYLNKNTLLSNYDEATIRTKMEDFANDLNDTIYMEYEKVFQYPTLEDCKDILDKRIKKKKEIKVYAQQLLGKKLNEEEEQAIENRILNQIEPIIERELEKIKENIIKSKLKRFMLILRLIQDVVHSTYLRAYQGQERRTLRQHSHITETRGVGMSPQASSTNNPLDAFRRGR